MKREVAPKVVIAVILAVFVVIGAIVWTMQARNKPLPPPESPAEFAPVRPEEERSVPHSREEAERRQGSSPSPSG